MLKKIAEMKSFISHYNSPYREIRLRQFNMHHWITYTSRQVNTHQWITHLTCRSYWQHFTTIRSSRDLSVKGSFSPLHTMMDSTLVCSQIRLAIGSPHLMMLQTHEARHYYCKYILRPIHRAYAFALNHHKPMVLYRGGPDGVAHS